ncbi:uncharacterized protein LOC118646961 [Monomorium pharaonis]|uniref:uncharacterized protein LOC118646961 n=1 Tax=Monomorium pharaonis TaxID=307658 RepID=UPI0017464964|nr:uncharacterized protein LOC118646961 [Monomorium pharaonis]
MEEIHVPGHDNSPSIEHILCPISYMSWFMGVGVVRPRRCSKFVTIIICILNLVLCSYLLYLIQMYVFQYVTSGFDFVYNFVLSHTTYLVSAYYYSYHRIKYNKWPELMDKIKEFDRKIKRETYINDQLVKVIETIAIFITFAYFSLYTRLIYNFIEDSFAIEGVMIFLLYYIIIQSLINSFVFDIVVYVLYHRHQAINKLIGHLDELSDDPLIALKIRRIRELHNDICDLVAMVNDMHSIYLLLCSANCFFTITISLFHISKFGIGVNALTFAFFVMYLITYAIQIGPICWICTLVRQEFDKTKIIICTMTLKCKSIHFDIIKDRSNQMSSEVRPPLEYTDSEKNFDQSSSQNWNYVMENAILLRKFLDQNHVRNEINDFFIQLQHRQVSFTACGFFEMNNNLLCKFIGITVTYLVIFLQFSS